MQKILTTCFQWAKHIRRYRKDSYINLTLRLGLAQNINMKNSQNLIEKVKRWKRSSWSEGNLMIENPPFLQPTFCALIIHSTNICWNAIYPMPATWYALSHLASCLYFEVDVILSALQMGSLRPGTLDELLKSTWLWDKNWNQRLYSYSFQMMPPHKALMNRFSPVLPNVTVVSLEHTAESLGRMHTHCLSGWRSELEVGWGEWGTGFRLNI